RLCVFLPLLETAFRAGVRAGVINRLSLGEQFDRSVDSRCLWSLRLGAGENQRCKEHEYGYAHEKLFHTISFHFQNEYFNASCSWRIGTAVVLITPKP